MFSRFSVKSVRYVRDIRLMSTKLAGPISLSVDNEGIATVAMQREPANLMDMDLMQDFIDSLDEISLKKCKGFILTSSLSTVFTGGIDLKVLYKPDEARLKRFFTMFADVMVTLAEAEFPTAVAINGHAAAGGCILSSLFEYRVMVNNKGTIGVNDTLAGIVPSVAVIEVMRYLLGNRRAELILTTSEMFTPEAALKIGLVDKVATDQEDALKKCEQFIRRFDHIPNLARSVTKKRISEPSIRWLKDNRELYVTKTVESIINPLKQRIFENYMQVLKQRKISK